MNALKIPQTLRPPEPNYTKETQDKGLGGESLVRELGLGCVRRGFILSDGRPITVSDLLPRAYPRLKRFQDWHRSSLRRALLKEASIIARNRFGRGRPNLWTPQSMRHDATWNQKPAKDGNENDE